MREDGKGSIFCYHGFRQHEWVWLPKPIWKRPFFFTTIQKKKNRPNKNVKTCFSIFLFPSSPFFFLLMIHTQVILSCGGQLSKFRKNVVCLESFFFLWCREKEKQIHFSMKDWLMKFKSRFLTRFTDFPLTLDQYPKLETFHTENAIFSQLHVTIKENSYKRTRPILLPNKPHMHILARQGVYLSCGLRGPFFFFPVPSDPPFWLFPPSSLSFFFCSFETLWNCDKSWESHNWDMF